MIRVVPAAGAYVAANTMLILGEVSDCCAECQQQPLQLLFVGQVRAVATSQVTFSIDQGVERRRGYSHVDDTRAQGVYLLIEDLHHARAVIRPTIDDRIAWFRIRVPKRSCHPTLQLRLYRLVDDTLPGAKGSVKVTPLHGGKTTTLPRQQLNRGFVVVDVEVLDHHKCDIRVQVWFADNRVPGIGVINKLPDGTFGFIRDAGDPTVITQDEVDSGLVHITRIPTDP